MKLQLLVLACALPLPAALHAMQAEPLSRRNANYTIDVRLDPGQKTLEAREVLRWRNVTGMPAAELRFHLYWNAWKNNRSTWMREDALRPPRPGRNRKKPREGDWGWCDVQSLKVLPTSSFAGADLTSRMSFISPDDGNAEDRTVLAVPLPRAVSPGEEIQVEIAWRSKIPRTFARTGYRGNFFFIVHWFPKIGVFREDGTWNCRQFHAGTEFFADYGVYDVRMTVPGGWLLGATGLPQSVRENADGTSTHHYVQADVHDFAWTTSPDYREAFRSFEEPGLEPVRMRLLYQPEHERQVERHFRAVEAALRYYGSWYGPYPYGHVTIVDPAWGSGAGGMEYPTLFTCGTRYFNPEGGGSPEGVTVHEAGHQFWYGIVGNDEFEHAWLDEGLNTFSTARVMETAFGESFFVERFFRNFIPVSVRSIRIDRETGGNRLDGYRRAARSDVQATPTYLYHPATGSNISYAKTALWLAMLEKDLGWETLRGILSAFFERWKFRHPGPEDFFAVASEIAGKDLDPFFDAVHRTAVVFDYAIDSVASEEVRRAGRFGEGEGDVPGEKETAGPMLYESRVVVRRLQDGILPVDVLLRFEDGEEVRETWDGEGLWKLYTVVRPSRLEYAVVDPERRILLDVDYANNSRLLRSKASFPSYKWASKWMIWLQHYLMTLASLA